MNTEQTRKLVAELAVAAAVCGGVYAVIAGPLRDRAIEAEANLAAIIGEHDVAASMLADLPRIVETLDATREGVEGFTARNRAALDESEMFATVMDLADAAGVELDQIAPVGRSPSPGHAKAPGAFPGDHRVGYTLVGGGSYESTRRFLAQLQSDWAYCAPRQVRITPDYQAGPLGDVRFSITIEVFSFDVSPIVLAPSSGEGTP